MSRSPISARAPPDRLYNAPRTTALNISTEKPSPAQAGNPPRTSCQSLPSACPSSTQASAADPPPPRPQNSRILRALVCVPSFLPLQLSRGLSITPHTNIAHSHFLVTSPPTPVSVLPKRRWVEFIEVCPSGAVFLCVPALCSVELEPEDHDEPRVRSALEKDPRGHE